jgi:hypothetical protein
MVFRVVKEGTYWKLKGRIPKIGDMVWARMRIKAKVIEHAFRLAKKRSPSKVKIYSASGKLQVQSNW